jgi:Chalcone isomerase-like
MNNLRRLIVAGVVLTLGAPAWAITDPETKQSFPGQTACDGVKAKAAGVGVREATMGIDVYAVVVYVSPKAKGKSIRATSECVKIRARFVRDVEADKVRDAWKKGFRKYGLSTGDATVKKFLSVIRGEIKEKREMVMMTSGDKVVHTYMGRKVTITGAKKLAAAIKKVYLGGSPPAPTLVKSVRGRGVAKP